MSIKFGKRAAEKPKRIILMIAYTEKQAYNLFFKTLMYLMAVHPTKIILKGKDKPTKHEIHLKNGSLIMCYAAGIAGEGLRTYTLTDLVIDEAAAMAREVFVATMPMLSVTGGTMDMSSTPRGKQGFFWECSDDPELGDKIRDDFTRFYISAEDCPRHDQKFLKEQKETMTELEYAQEYLAWFTADITQIFPDALIKKTMVLDRRPLILPDRHHCLGVDVARMGEDETAFEILDIIERDKVEHVENIVTKKTLTTQTIKKIIELEMSYDFKNINVDGRGVGAGVVDQLLEEDETKRKVVSIDNAAKSLDIEEHGRRLLKEDLYMNLLRMMERGEIKLLKDPEIFASLKSVLYENTEKGMKIFGNNTHIAEGLIRAAWGVKQKGLNPYIL